MTPNLEEKRQTIIIIMLGILILTSIFIFVQPLKYDSKSRVLVIQNSLEGTDPYAISKSNEYLGGVLSNVISSEIFYQDVMGAGFNIDKDYFSASKNYKKEIEKWKKTVSASVVGDTGIMEINVYHPDSYQADQIARAVNYVLKVKHQNYHGESSNVIIKVIDEPTVSSYPVKPNIILDYFLALVFGVIISLAYIYLFPEAKYSLSFLPKEKRPQANFKFQEPLAQKVNSFEAVGFQPAEEAAEAMAEPMLDEASEEENKNDQDNDNGNFSPKGNMNNIFG